MIPAQNRNYKNSCIFLTSRISKFKLYDNIILHTSLFASNSVFIFWIKTTDFYLSLMLNRLNLFWDLWSIAPQATSSLTNWGLVWIQFTSRSNWSQPVMFRIAIVMPSVKCFGQSIQHYCQLKSHKILTGCLALQGTLTASLPGGSHCLEALSASLPGGTLCKETQRVWQRQPSGWGKSEKDWLFIRCKGSAHIAWGVGYYQRNGSYTWIQAWIHTDTEIYSYIIRAHSISVRWSITFKHWN